MGESGGPDPQGPGQKRMMCGRGWNGGRADQEDADSNSPDVGRDNRKQVILEIISYDFMMD